jgi:Putative peptidoglycan binding domain
MKKLGFSRLPRRVGAGVALVISITAIIAIVLAVQSPSPTSGASGGSQASGATTVQRRDLVQTDTQAGTLSYAKPQTVYNRLSGTITWLPAVGQRVDQGQALYKVSGQPVILMHGTTPAYRDLSGADSAGPDIFELNRDLVQLGFNPDGIVVDDVWQPATTAAVDAFQQSLGEAPTGVLSLGQIVFLPSDQVVSTLDATLGSTGGGSGSPSGSAAADTSPTSSAEFVSLNTATPSTTGQTGPSNSAGTRTTPKNPKTLAALLALLRAETTQLRAETAELRAAQQASARSSGANASKSNNSLANKSGGGASNSGNANSGGSGTGGSGTGGSGNGSGSTGGGSATAILQTSSTQLVAIVDLDASKQSEAKVGEKVTVQLPTGTTVNGTITAVSSVAQTSSGSGNGSGSGNSANNGNSGNNGSSGSNTATIPVTIALNGHLNGAGLDQAAVSVNFAQARANNVLSVPVTALLATSGGGYAVQEAAAPRRLIPVTTGLFAAGFVEISGAGIYPGLQVTDSQG